jgi:putative ABC transport system ATP-binding protein
LIKARALTRTYRRGSETIDALKGIDLDIGPGEFVCVLGPSGAGKTTLLNLCGLMDRPTKGALSVAGVPISGNGRALSEARMDSLRRRNIGFVFGEFFLIPGLSALQNVELPMLWTGKTDSPRARELLEKVGLGHRINHTPRELSGGEMQRVAVARALSNKPKLLLADEPTANLDTRTRDDIFGLLRELNAGGLTVVLATHDTEIAGRSDRVIRLDEGRVIE